MRHLPIIDVAVLTRGLQLLLELFRCNQGFRFRAGLEFRQLSYSDVHYVKKKPIRWRVGASVGWLVLEHSVKRVHSDDACAMFAIQLYEPAEIAENLL